MANHGNKFVSANLNKSYGQQSHFHNPSYSGSSYGQAAAGRGRPSHATGGGGMVVLSRPRSAHKTMPKLSVPPPLNLPSIRKEHEKFDLSGSGSGAAGGSGSGIGSHLNSTSMGWTKPGIVKDETSDSQVVNGLNQSVVVSDSVSNRSTAYVQPLARSQPYTTRVEKAMVLRGEDFPSLQAAMPLPATSASVQKQKDGLQKKNQQLVTEEDGSSANEQSDSYRLSSPVRMRPQGQPSYPRTATEMKENGFNRFGGGSRTSDQPRKPDYFPGPLPLVRLNPRSDWADDERDTGHGFGERGRESKTEAYWDREFEMPRTSVLPHKPPYNNNQFERPGPASRREETGKSFSSDVLKIETDTQRDSRTPSREGSESKTWRSSAIQKETQQTVNDRNDLGRSNVMESKYVPPSFSDKGNRDSTYARTDLGHGQNWNNNSSSFNSRGSERNTRDRYGSEQSNNFNKFTVSKPSFSSVSKGFSTNDPTPSFSREKRVYSKTEKPYVEDHFGKDFGSTGYDGSDPFSAGLVGVIKRRKDVVKPNDFHDPVRESFEAELERVQKMQEMERQRIIDEQERAIEQARREEEERQRMIREEEERQRRMEEEAREATWRAEQERLEAIQKAEELKIAREEEKRRIFIEEERRKEAAKQKLLELEARIARRQAETSTKVDNSTPVSSREVDLDSWEDGERMVERITTSASSDSHVSNRPFDMNPRPHPPMEGSSSGFVDGGKFVNSSWRRDAFDNGNTSSFPRKDFYGGPGYMQPPRPYFKGGVVQEPHVDDFAPQGWSPYGDAESEFYDNVGDRYGIGWGQGQRWYPSRETDDLYAYGRPRFSMRQPRVLPPPSLPSIHKASDNEVPGPSNSEETESHYHTESRNESQAIENNERNLEKDSTPRCDSQSSLSVSSPPTSPTQLSHDELEESRIAEGKEETDLYNESSILNESGGKEADAQSSVTGGEDEEWTVNNNEELQEQEEYDEDEDGYQEEDEVHEVYDENLDMNRDFEELDGKDSSSHMNNLVLGFDEGVEVGIPSDELEQDSRNEQVSGSILEELRVDETEKAIQDSNQSVFAPQTSTTPRLDNNVSSSTEMAADTSLLSGSSAQSQADLPIKLQFGLFSGPSLIPSPVPAIQIGSIQMPLHLHPPVGPSIGHNHSSQAPLFQFGQLRYTSPVSQGILPMSFVQQPSLQQTHYNPNQNIQLNQTSSAHKLVQTSDNNGGARNNASVTKVQTQISSTDDKAKTGSNSFDPSSQTSEKDHSSSKNQGSSYINKGKKVSYSVKNPGYRSSFRSSDDPRVDSTGFQRRPPQRAIQRTEFRVRESSNKNPSTSSVSSNTEVDVVKSRRNGRGVGTYSGTGYKHGNVPNKVVKQMVESESSVSGSQEMDSGRRNGKEKIVDNISKVDVDAPIQTGYVRVYEQSGIEIPSDEDDFIEVRSKRQMLNDRREQREKEIKAKSRLTKPPRKPRTSSSSTMVSNKVSTASNNVSSNLVGSVKKVSSSRFTTMNSQPLAPIGTPSVNSDTQTNTRSHSFKPVDAGSASVISAPAKDLNSVLDNVHTSLGSWGNVQINQQVMSLTQTQLDEAMKPTSVAEPSSSSSPSVLAKDKAISSSSSPISSLLAGEKIQFGAVTSPTVLPPSSRVISHVIGAYRSDPKISHNNLPQQSAENDCTIFFGKNDKKQQQSNESGRLEDSEAVAEAAASAAAAAAISTDEIVLPDTSKTFRDAHADSITGGGSQQSRGEESLSVSLPADLSVETHPISLWPALPSPQPSPNQILSHFPGAPPPSHFPFYDMNSMLSGGPIFTFGPPEESSGTQSQSQKTAMPASAPPAHIQNWHSPVDSFYGPPAGFAGPFISPSGGIPGVQPPPHMVVYNHYAPVGQFGQVGLSFMGTTYIPSGKQPDWKHNPGSASMDNTNTNNSNNVSNNSNNNMNLASGQRNNNNNAQNMAPPNAAMPHHMAPPRSPILPMPTPMPMFDVSPFQSAADMSVQARWSHIPAPPLHSMPMQQQPQPQQGEVGVILPHPPQFNHMHHHHHIDTSSLPQQPPHRFSEPPSSSTPSEKKPIISKPQFPNELGVVTESSAVSGTSNDAASAAAVVAQSGNSGNNGNNSGFKNQQQKNMTGNHHHQSHQSHQSHNNQYNSNQSGYGYNNQNSGGWGSHRRSGGFHGRNQSLGADKNFPNTKMKQVYVAKQTRSGPSTVP